MSQPRSILPFAECRSPWTSLALLCLSVLVGAWIGQFFASLCLLWSEGFVAPWPLRAQLLFLQATIATSGLIVAPALYLCAFEQRSLRLFFQWQQGYALPMALTLGLMASFIVVDTWVIQWNKALQFPSWLRAFEVWAQQKEAAIGRLFALLTTFDSVSALWIGIGILGVIPAVGEELFFRGILQNLLYRLWPRPHSAIVLSALVFSAIHLQFYGFFPRFLLGTLFGYVYWWTRDLMFPMVAHLFNNTLVLVGTYLYQHDLLAQDPSNWPVAPWPIGLFCALAAMVLAWILRHQGATRA